MLAATVWATARAPSNDALRTNAERRCENVLDPFTVAGWHDPVTDGDVGADVANPIGAGGVVGTDRATCSSHGRCGVTRAGNPGDPSASHARLEVGPPTESVGH